jgi:L-iditol 2-dehydrogenase
MPVPGHGEALVRVTAVGVCGSDVHWWREGHIGGDRIVAPLILGHECAGVIEIGHRRGERVAIDPAIPCGRCEFCQQGNPNLCPALRFAGHAPHDGALRQYVAWPEHCLVPLPDSISPIEAVMLEPLGVALYSVERGQVTPGMSVGVFGCGTIGLSVIQVARAAGAVSIFATDLPGAAARIKAARSFGAEVFEADNGREAEKILKATGGRGVDVAFEAAGDPEAVEAVISAVKPGGQAILIGIALEDRIAFTASTARRKDLTIKVVHRMKHTYPRALQLVQSGRVDVRSLVTHRFPLAEIERAYSSAEKREGIKVVVDC